METSAKVNVNVEDAFVMLARDIKVKMDKKLVCLVFVFKPPPPVGTGRGYMFSSHPSVPLSVHPSVHACVRPSVIHVVVLCFRDISSIC